MAADADERGTSAIRAKREELERSGLELGDERSGIETLRDDGRYQEYERGTIYWSPSTGAFAVHGPLLARYRELGGPEGSLGYPTADVALTGDARAAFSRFQKGSLYLDSGHIGLGVYVVPPTPVPCDLEVSGHGRWEVPHHGSGVVGVHAALVSQREVLFFSYRVPPGCPQWPAPYGESALLDLATGHVSTPAYVGTDGKVDPENLFCAGHAFLPDGSLMVAGGEREDGVVRTTSAVRAVHVFKSGSAMWEHVADCARGRWYCTCATLPDGKVLVVGGSVRVTWNGTSNATFEIYDPVTRTVSPEYPITDPSFASWSSYPFVFVLPGRKALVHFGTRTRFLDLDTRTFLGLTAEAAARPNRNGRTYGVQGSAVLLPLLPTSSPPYRARVMTFGGGGPGNPGSSTPATETCEILDLGWRWRKPATADWLDLFSSLKWPSWWFGPKWLSEPALEWNLVAPMANPRVMPDTVLLPDGKVFVCGGSRAGKEGTAKDPVFDAEIYDPETDTWTTVCHMTVPRLYHATALLLPDGSVMTAGTDCAWNPAPYNQSQLKVEVYRPPYFFRGPRPHIGQPPGRLVYGAEVTVPTNDAGKVVTAAILRCSSVTHSFNPDQRYVGLTVVDRDAGSVRLAIPTDPCVAPPGPYLLFLLTEDKIPSVGRRLLVGESQLPTAALDTVAGALAKAPPWPPPVSGRRPSPFERDLAERLAELERQVVRLAAFIEARERPLHAGHGAEPEHELADDAHKEHKESSREPAKREPAPRGGHGSGHRH